MVYVDELRPYGNRLPRGMATKKNPRLESCHLAADSEEELRAFARRIGLKMEWIQKPGTRWVHFDLTPNRRTAAVLNGAKEVTWREMAVVFGGVSFSDDKEVQS